MSPRKSMVVDQIQNVQLPYPGFESSVAKVRKNLAQVLGGDVHIHLGRHPRFDPTRLSSLMAGDPPLRPLLWSDLDEQQKKSLKRFLPYVGTDDYVTYGDTVICLCPKTQWDEAQRRKQAANAEDPTMAIARQFGRETGLSVDTAWEEKGMSPPRLPKD